MKLSLGILMVIGGTDPVWAQEVPPGTYAQQPTDAQGYYTSPLPPPSAPMDYGSQTQGTAPESHMPTPQEAYTPPPVSYAPPRPAFDPIPQTGTNTLGASKYQRPEKRTRYHHYSPYTDVVMIIRAQEDPAIADHIQALREEGRRKKMAAREQRLLRRTERRTRELARIDFVRERAVLQPMDPVARRAAFQKYLEEKRKYKESSEASRWGFVQEQREKKIAQKRIRIEGRRRLMAFQRGDFTKRQERAIASPTPAATRPSAPRK